MSPQATRCEELSVNLAHVRERIDSACVAAGRAPGDVGLVVVTKFFPETDVRLLAELGVSDVGENREQEARVKSAACAGLGLRWHFIGNLQSNKAAAVAGHADVVESVDRSKLLGGLSRGAHERGHELECLVQVDLDDSPAPARGGAGRGGAQPADVLALAEGVASTDGLVLRGLMAVAPLGRSPAPAFARLAELSERLRQAHPGADRISAGMSGDLEEAVAAGATHVRVGSAILGTRPAIK